MIQRKAVSTPSVVSRLPATTKLFVLDTNVLMHDPTSLFRFEEHDLFIPMATLEELEETAKLFLLLKDRPHRCLTPQQVAELRSRPA